LLPYGKEQPLLLPISYRHSLFGIQNEPFLTHGMNVSIKQNNEVCFKRFLDQYIDPMRCESKKTVLKWPFYAPNNSSLSSSRGGVNA